MPRGERHSREQGGWEQSSRMGDGRRMGNITPWVLLKRRCDKKVCGREGCQDDACQVA